MPEAGNVVRLPREWLGPPEELVPFGPSARETAEERREPTPRDAAGSFPDFWGEESAALQDVIEAPAGQDDRVVSTSTQSDHPTLQPAQTDGENARTRRWQTPLGHNRQTRVLAAAVVVLCVIAGTVVLASQGPRSPARISTVSSTADPFGRSLPGAVAVAQASLTRAETSLIRAARHRATQRRHPAHPQAPAVSTPPTAADSAPSSGGSGTSQTVDGSSSPPPSESATPAQSQYSPPAEPAQPAASTNQPAHPSPLGGLACSC